MRRSALSIEDPPQSPRSPRIVPDRGPTELQRQQKQNSHQKLLDAAQMSFAELTYAATTIDHIVSRAAVNRSTFYRHFDSKFAIAKALFVDFWPRLFAEFDRLSSSDPDDEEIDDWIGNLIVFYREHRSFYMTLGQIPILEPEGGQWEENVRTELLTRLGNRIQAFRRATSPSEATPELRVRVRMWMSNFESGLYFLAFKDAGSDTAALRRYVVRETRRLISEEARPPV
jgi:AcrR family transcriptional regulator